MKRIIIVLAFLLSLTSGYGQKRVYNLPEVPDYVILKCDFHMHTVFSDGAVWPIYRVEEASGDGLDAISITDHIEYQPKKKYVPTDHNAAWSIAAKRAEERNIILVKGAEITRGMPPGHLNVLFIKDATLLEKDSVMDSFEEAINQGAFIEWNHPGWKNQEPTGIPKLYPIHLELLKRGWLHGIEFFNETEYYAVTLDWCLKYNLAVMANSDVHDIISEYVAEENMSHRPMTLVFAKEKSEESLKKAMFEAKTVAWFGDNIAGPKELVEMIFYNSIAVSKPYLENEKTIYLEITNNSDIPYTLVNGPEGAPAIINLGANSITRVPLNKGTKLPIEYDVRNIMTSSDKVLKVKIK